MLLRFKKRQYKPDLDQKSNQNVEDHIVNQILSKHLCNKSRKLSMLIRFGDQNYQ